MGTEAAASGTSLSSPITGRASSMGDPVLEVIVTR